MITDFIQKAVGELGIDEQQASTATGGILNLLKDNVDGGDFSSLLGSLPGADSLMETASSAVSDGSSSGGIGGMLGGLGGMLGGGGLGGKLGALAGVSSLLSAANINTDQLSGLAGMFFDYIKENADDGLVGKLVAALPDEISSMVA